MDNLARLRPCWWCNWTSVEGGKAFLKWTKFCSTRGSSGPRFYFAVLSINKNFFEGPKSIVGKGGHAPVCDLKMDDVGKRAVQHGMVPLRIADELDHARLAVRGVLVENAGMGFLRVDHFASHAYE